jgi:cell division protein ZapA
VAPAGWHGRTGADEMADKNKVVVKIAGNEYVISGAESPEYIQRIALLVDRRMLDITRKNHLLSTSMASVLTALNMADELIKMQEARNKAEFELNELKKKYLEVKEDAARLKNENGMLKEVQTQLQIELSKREAELKEVRNTLSTLSGNRGTKNG